MMSSESLSVVLSVENAQSYLAGDLNALIDCLADLSSRFEIIVVDNASRDFTVEVLEDMHARYPQVRYRRFAQHRSHDEANQVGLSMATGEFIFSSPPGCRVDIDELRRLWSLRVDPRLLVARSRTTARRVDAGLIHRLSHWAQRLTHQSEPMEPAFESFGGLQMMRREAMQKLQPSQADAAIAAMHRDSRLEISHISHQQLASPKLVDARRSRSEATKSR